jgi:serine/threonine-protein kinase
MKSTSTVATEYRIGEKVPGTNWVVRSVLGRGGMGVVLDVEKEASGLRMAMKVLHPALARSDEFTERFLEEVRLLSALRHPNIVDVTDCDTLADGSPYIMMERLEGRTLRQALSDNDIVFAAENVWNIIGQLCSALHCAHTARPPIVHRDVKPANVFLHDRRHFVSNVKLIDFGVSAVVDEKRAAGAPMGTARYMAPEACRGEAPTPQVDIYALGVIVYEMLTRALPWDLESRSAEAWMNAHLTLDPIPPSRRAPWIPRSVDECLLRALHKDRTQRQRDALEFHEQLGELPFVDDGSGNHRYEGITAPTPETLAHGRAGARERAARRAAVTQGSAPASMDVSVEVQSVSYEPRERDVDSEAASVSSDVGVSGGELEASLRSSYEESGDTPLSSASEPPARTPRRRARAAGGFRHGGRPRSWRRDDWLSMEPRRWGQSAAGGRSVAVVLEPGGHAPAATTRRARPANQSRGRRARRVGKDHRFGRRDSRRIRENGRSTGVGQWRPSCLPHEAGQAEEGVERPGGA